MRRFVQEAPWARGLRTEEQSKARPRDRPRRISFPPTYGTVAAVAAALTPISGRSSSAAALVKSPAAADQISRCPATATNSESLAPGRRRRPTQHSKAAGLTRMSTRHTSRVLPGSGPRSGRARTPSLPFVVFVERKLNPWMQIFNLK